jgi:uncharacterized membrane protein
MFSKLYNYWQLTRESLFYVPVVVCLFYLMGVAACYGVDTVYPEYLKNVPFMYRGGIEDAKAIVRLLVSSTMTMTTLVVSLTMVVLSLSASQLGPRLIKIFLGDRTTQVYIGVFFGSIAFCFALLVILHDKSLARATPYLCVTVALAACFANLFVLLAFLSHVARSSVADNVIAKVGRELKQSIQRLTKSNEKESTAKIDAKETFDNGRDLFSLASGYVQTINYQTILSVATARNIVIRLNVSAGDYLLHGEKAGMVSNARDFTPEDEKAVFDAIVLGNVRTASQDIEYSARHLVEVGLRALSPGINDNFTAISALDKLSDALAILLRENLPRHQFVDDDNNVRVIGKARSEPEIIFNAFSRIRHAGQDKPDVLKHLLRIIGTLKSLADSQNEHMALNNQLDYIQSHIDAHFQNSPEGAILNTLLDKTRKMKD